MGYMTGPPSSLPASAVVDRRPVIAPVLLAPAAVASGGGGSVGPDRRLVFVTIPAFNRTVTVKPLDRMVAEAVNQVLARSDLERGSGALAESDDDAPAIVPAGLADGVIAAHESRIAVLQQRIETLRVDGIAASLLDELRERLHRAEAARRLAVARAGGDALPIACRAGGDRSSCSSAAPVLASGNGRAHHGSTRPVVAPYRVDAITTFGTASPAVLVASVPGSRRGPWQLAGLTRMKRPTVPMLVPLPHGSWQPMTMPIRAVTYRAMAGRSRGYGQAAYRLASARRSLAAARRLLTGEDGAAHPTAKPRLVIAGLWRWEGSETWKLVPGRTGAG